MHTWSKLGKTCSAFGRLTLCAMTMTLSFACDGSGGGTLGQGRAAITGADCGDTSALMPGAPWPMWGGCPGHGGRSDIPGALDGTIDWMFTTQDSTIQQGAAVGSDGTIYFGARAGFNDYRVFAVRADGTEIWRSSKIQDPIKTTPALGANGTLYVGTDDNFLYALFTATGRQKWAFQTNANIESSPALQGSVVYFGSDDRNVYAVEDIGTSGRLKWKTATNGLVESSPAVGADGTVYIGSDDSKLYALNGSTGAVRWSRSLNLLVRSSPVISQNGTVYVGSDDDRLYAINAASGAVRWSYKTGLDVRSSAAIGPSGIVYIGSNDNNVYALTDLGTSAQLKWKFKADGNVKTPILVGANDIVYFGSDDHKVRALRGSDGAVKWTATTGGEVEGPLAIGLGGVIFAGSEDRKFYAIGNSNQPPTPSAPPPPAPLTSTGVHCGDRSGLALTAWPMRGFCPAHLGQSPFLGSRDGRFNWSFQTNSGAVRGQPVLTPGGAVYVGATDNRFYSIRVGGTAEWSFDAGSGIRSSAAIGAAGKFYVGSDSGKLYSLDQTGASEWVYDASTLAPSATDSALVASPAVDGAGNLYVASRNGFLFSLTKQGVLRWSSNVGVPIESSPAIGTDGRIYAGIGTQGVRAVNATNGAVVWNRTGIGEVVSSPAIGANGQLYVGSTNGRVYAIRLTDGTITWNQNTSGSVTSSPAIGPDGAVTVGSSVGVVYSFTAAGTVKWQVPVGKPVLGSPAISSDGLVYIGADDGLLRALESTNGSLVWSFDAGDPIRSAPAIGSDGTIYFGTEGGKVFSLGSGNRNLVGIGTTGPSGNEFGGPTGAVGLSAPVVATVNGATLPNLGRTERDTSHTGFPAGQDSCPNGGVGSASGTGLKIRADRSGFDLTQQPPPGAGQPDCRLRFCQAAPDGTEVEVPVTLAQLNTQPPRTTTCDAIPGQPFCPIDTTLPLGPDCTSDANCTSGQVCGVICDDVACATFRRRCGSRIAECSSGLSAEPTASGPPCTEYRECAETGPVLGFTGDPVPQKPDAKSLNELLTPQLPQPPLNPIPERFPSYLTRDACSIDDLGNGDLAQSDPRAGSSGNSKWGVFFEPNVFQHLDVKPSPIGGGTISLDAEAGLVAGAKIWGERVTAIDVDAHVTASECTVMTRRSIKFFGDDVAPTGPDANSRFDIGTVAGCAFAQTDFLAMLRKARKALYDVKAVKDSFDRNGPTADFCKRTADVFGQVEAQGQCTRASLEAWITGYQNALNNVVGSGLTAIASRRAAQQKFFRGETSVGVPGDDFDLLGASFTYPVGPVTISIEVDMSGSWGIDGSLTYGLREIDQLASTATITPWASLNAFAYAGVGLGPVTVGILGELLLMKVDAPITTGLELLREQRTDPRNVATSGLIDPTAVSESPLPRVANRWVANWTYGAGLGLEALSGQIDLAARIDLLFFDITFRKKLASWRGFKKNYNFVGKYRDPFENASDFGSFEDDVPFVVADRFHDSYVDQTSPLQPFYTLGPPDFPGVCGTPLLCAALDQQCGPSPQGNISCCGGLFCNAVTFKCDRTR